LGTTTENMFLEAFNHGIIMREMVAVMYRNQERCSHTEDSEIGIIIAIGYQHKYDILPESLRQKQPYQDKESHYQTLDLLKIR
jgi:hypothetical protein